MEQVIDKLYTLLRLHEVVVHANLRHQGRAEVSNSHNTKYMCDNLSSVYFIWLVLCTAVVYRACDHRKTSGSR